MQCPAQQHRRPELSVWASEPDNLAAQKPHNGTLLELKTAKLLERADTRQALLEAEASLGLGLGLRLGVGVRVSRVTVRVCIGIRWSLRQIYGRQAWCFLGRGGVPFGPV